MKSLTKDFFKTTLITSLAFIFAIGLSVVNAEWTTAPAGTPPVCPTGYPGCDAPLNVSSASQVKGGGLSLASLIVRGGIQIISGNPAIGKVLTSDGVGNATWQTPTTCTAAVSGTDTFTTSGTWTVPAGVTSIKVKVWGAGGNGGSGAPSYAGAGSLGGGGGGGGGAGGYAEKTINIPSGTTSYQVVVGTPGTAGFSAFDSTSVKATNGTSAVNHTGNESTGGAGGAGGAPVGSYSASQSGIAGSAGTNGTYISGCPGGFSQDGNGGNGGASYSPSTGGIGGVLANCSQAGPSGTTGTIGGGGGGGAGYGGAGGVGSSGRVVIEYSTASTCSGGTTGTGSGGGRPIFLAMPVTLTSPTSSTFQAYNLTTLASIPASALAVILEAEMQGCSIDALASVRKNISSAELKLGAVGANQGICGRHINQGIYPLDAGSIQINKTGGDLTVRVIGYVE